MVDMKEEDVKLIFDVLAESLFDLPVGSGRDSVIDCTEFSNCSNDVLREAVRQTNNPLRPYMFWNKQRQQAVQSLKYLDTLGKNILSKYRETASAASKNSIISHLIAHDYPSEEHRLSDLLVFLVDHFDFPMVVG